MGKLVDDVQQAAVAAVGALGGVAKEWAMDQLHKADRDDSESADRAVGDADRAPGGTNEDTAESNPVPTEPPKEDPKILMWDPFAIVEQLGYKDRPTAISYGTLKAITFRMPIVQAIIQTRLRQLEAFSKVQHNRYQLGFRIKLRDSEKEPTKVERDWIQQMESLMLRCGVTDNPRAGENFKTFLKKLGWDALVYDQMCFEVIPNLKGFPAQWLAADGATMRLADSATTYLKQDFDETVRYVQIYDSMIIAEFTAKELMFGIRNPRTDIRLQGYGVSELEMLTTVITSLLHGFEYNRKFFTQGSAPKGIINFKGAIPERQLQGFRRQWYQMLSGVENAWRTPITNAEELQYIGLQQSSRDMEFNAWMDFLIKIACSMFGMDPIEVNFQYGNVGQKNTLKESSNREKITESKERGLRPLLEFIADCINEQIIWPINEAFCLEFVGLDAMTRSDAADLAGKRVKTIMTVDELRAEDDLPPLPDGLGEVILDPVYLQHMQAKTMGGGEEGMPGEEGEFGEEGAEGEEEEMDFEAALSQFEEEADEEDEAEEEEAKKKEVQKSNSREWTVEL